MFRIRLALPALVCAALTWTPARATTVHKTLCVYDPSGESGDFYKNTVPWALAALDWGVDFGHPQVRQDEKIASEDFRAGKCDVVIMTGVRARNYVPTAGTVEAIGAIQNYHALKTVIGALARPTEAKLMKNGEYESAGIFPAGSVYLFVHDRKVTDAAALAGLRIATFTYDDAASTMVQRVGAAAVSADTSTFSGMFNSGSVDVAYAPVTAYKPLELGKGVGTTGGVVHFPLAQLTFQVVIRSNDMPAGFAQSSRAWLFNQFDTLMKSVDRAEKQVVARQWLEIPNQKSYDALFQSVRVELGTRGVYDPVMLHKLKLVRCREDSARAECAESKE
jgi:hypothetical protein